MRTLKVARDNIIPYAVILVLFSFVITYQLRSSFETVHIERHLDFYLPFLMDQFTNRIGARDHFAIWELGGQFDVEHYSVLRAGDEVLDINGQQFRGMSLYLRELLKAEYQPHPLPPDFQWYPFVLTVRSSGSRVHRVEVGFPHCTCGIPTVFDAAVVWVIAPVFCVLLGFAIVCLRPRALLSWAFLGLMLSVSQLQLWPEWYPGFQETSNAMAWSDWFRLPALVYRTFVQHAWPAALLFGSAHFCQTRRMAYRAAVIVAASYLVYAGLQACLQIAWSEDYRRLVFLHEALKLYTTEFVVISFAAVAAVGCFLSRRLGLAVLSASLVAMAALYSPAARITTGSWYTYSDNTHRFVASIPVFHATIGLITLSFSAVSVIAALIIFRGKVTLLDAAGFILCLPLAVLAAGCLGDFWYPFSIWSSKHWLWLGLIFSALGLFDLSWSVLRRTSPISA